MADHNYEQAIRQLSKLNADEIISNSSPNHAIALFSVLLDRAKSEVRLFSGNLEAKVFGNSAVVASFKEAHDQ